MASQERRRRPALILAALLSLAAGVRGEDAPLPPLDLDEEWRWVSFGEEAGLPVGRPLDLVEARDGTPWAVTTAGAAWFDGHEWIAERCASPAPCPNPGVIVPFGPHGCAGYTDAGLTVYEPGSHAHLTPRMDGEPVTIFDVADRGELLLLRARVGDGPTRLMIVDPAHPEECQVEPRFGDVHQIVGGDGGTVLVASDLGVTLLESGTSRLLLPAQHHRYLVRSFAREGTSILISVIAPPGVRGTVRITADGQAVREADEVMLLEALPDGDTLAITDLGVAMVGRGGTWRPVGGARDELFSVAAAVARPDGDLWLVSDAGVQLFRRSSRMWKTRRFPGADARNHVSDILIRKDGSIWLATVGGVVVLHADGAVETIDRAPSGPLTLLTTIAEDAWGRVWVGSGSSWLGVMRLDEHGEWRRFGPEDGLDLRRVHGVRTLADGSTWFLGLPDEPQPEDVALPCVFRMTGEDTFEEMRPPGGFRQSRAYDVALLPDGAACIGTSDGAWIHREGQWERLDTGGSLGRGRVFALAADRDGRLVLANQWSGLGVRDTDGALRWLTRADGLADDDVWDVAVDDRGRIWASTRGGLSVVDGERITSWRAGSGLPNSRLWPVVVDGDRILVGSLGGGLGVLDLDEVAHAPIRVDVQLALAQDRDALVRWRALSLLGDLRARAIPTRWRLDGGPWSGWSRDREVWLHDLAPGEHRVDVEAHGLFADDEPSGGSALIRVPLPSWRQAPFLALLAGSAAAVAGGAAFLTRQSVRERRALVASERRYRQLVENATDVVFSLDGEGRLEWANAAGAQLMGIERGQMVGRSITDTLLPSSVAVTREALARCRMTGEVMTFEVQAQHAGGAQRIVEVTVGPAPDGPRTGWQGIARDITDRRRREADRQRAERLESLGLVAGGMAHDVNNVLAGVVGHAGLALTEIPEGSAARSRLVEIERAAMHCAEIARHVLDYAGRGKFASAPVDVAATVSRAVAICEAGGRDGRVGVQAEPGLPLVEGDAGQIERVVVNLIRNALQAMTGTAGQVNVRLAKAAPDAVARIEGACWGRRPDGPAVLIEVADSGHGMDDEALARAFDPFFTTRKEGRGLGLAAALGVVRVHGGCIIVSSAAGRGTTFTVALPVMGAEEPS